MVGKVISLMDSERYDLEFLEEYDCIEKYENHYKIRHKNNTYSIKPKEFLVEQTAELDYGGFVVEVALKDRNESGDLTSVELTIGGGTREYSLTTYEEFLLFEATIRGFVGMGYPIKVVK